MCGISVVKHDRRNPYIAASILGGSLEGQKFAVGGKRVRRLLQLPVRQSLWLTRTIGTDEVKARTLRVYRAKHDVAAVRSPDRAAVGSWQEGQAGRRAAVQVFHPDV